MGSGGRSAPGRARADQLSGTRIYDRSTWSMVKPSEVYSFTAVVFEEVVYNMPMVMPLFAIHCKPATVSARPHPWLCRAGLTEMT